MLKSLRYRLLAWFLAFVLLTAAFMVPASLIYHAREKSIGQVTQHINSLYIDFLKDTKAVNSFLNQAPRNADFFISGENTYLNYHLKASAGVSVSLDELLQSPESNSFGITRELELLKAGLRQYNTLLDSLVYLVYKRGYRNFGLAGELDDYGELLESTAGLSKHDVYHLRRIEDGYFYNNEAAAVDSFRNLIAKIKRTAGTGTASPGRTLELIDSYAGAFLRLVALEKQSGIRNNIALRAMLNQRGGYIESVFAGLSDKSVVTQEALIHQLNIYYVLFLCLILCLSVVFSYAASKHVVSHLEALTDYISVLTSNHQVSGQSIDLHNSAREVKQIYRGFRNLLSQLKIWERQRDKALRSAEFTQQRYQELADMLPQSIFETNNLGNYTYVNKAWYKAFRYSALDLNQGLNLIETLVSESTDQDILGKGKIEDSNFIAIRKDGTRFPASVYTDNILEDGVVSGRRGIIVDITDKIAFIRTLQQETSKAKTSDELKSSFLANMSHEIRTPMNSIIGFSNLLASDQIPEIQKKDFVKYIRTSSEILLNLVDDIIDIAKIEAGELKIVKKDCELYALGKELLTTSYETRKKFNKHHLDISFDPDPGVQELYLKTDPYRLRQVLVNLINNAVKFTETGSVEFGFRITEDKTIEFKVKDTGVGLTRNELDQIFERFKRSSQADEKHIAGTGLGLAISKNLVQLLGGEMWVDSVPGKGTTFTFTIPFLKSTRLPESNDSRSADQTGYNWKGIRILVAEDDPHSFAFSHQVLKKTQAELFHAQTGREALAIFRAEPSIDLVLMDIQLPEMDGMEAAAIIKSINSAVPVIAQTAFAMSGDREKLKKAGFDDYLAKPLDIKLFLTVINRFLSINRRPFLQSPVIKQELLPGEKIIEN